MGTLSERPSLGSQVLHRGTNSWTFRVFDYENTEMNKVKKKSTRTFQKKGGSLEVLSIFKKF